VAAAAGSKTASRTTITPLRRWADDHRESGAELLLQRGGDRLERRVEQDGDVLGGVVAAVRRRPRPDPPDLAGSPPPAAGAGGTAAASGSAATATVAPQGHCPSAPARRPIGCWAGAGAGSPPACSQAGAAHRPRATRSADGSGGLGGATVEAAAVPSEPAGGRIQGAWGGGVPPPTARADSGGRGGLCRARLAAVHPCRPVHRPAVVPRGRQDPGVLGGPRRQGPACRGRRGRYRRVPGGEPASGGVGRSAGPAARRGRRQRGGGARPLAGAARPAPAGA
jgi:hypothetical protein